MNKLTKEEVGKIHLLVSTIKEQVLSYHHYPTESILDSIVRFSIEIQKIITKQ